MCTYVNPHFFLCNALVDCSQAKYEATQNAFLQETQLAEEYNQTVAAYEQKFAGHKTLTEFISDCQERTKLAKTQLEELKRSACPIFNNYSNYK